MGLDGLIVIGGNGSLSVAYRLAVEERPADRRRAQDDRQRHRRHRRHVRLPHRRADRHRRHRPPAHHRREPRPGDGRRGDGPPQRLDRHLRRHRRRAPRVVADPGDPVRHRRGLSPTSTGATSSGRYASIVVVAEGAAADPRHARRRRAGVRPVRPRAPRRHRRRHRPRASTSAPASRPASCMLGHVQRGGTPTAFDRVLSTRFGVAAIDAVHAQGVGADGGAARRPRSCRRRSSWPSARPGPVDMTLYHDVAEVFFA